MTTDRATPSPLNEVVRLAFRLGVTAFGGPAAHIAMLRSEVVDRRAWLTEQRFLDLLGLTNLIPGPNSTELVMHVGKERAGNRGLWLAGAAFILPAAILTLVFAWLYVEYGTTAEGAWILRGIKPVVLAIVAQAIWNLGKTAFKSIPLIAVGVGVFALYLAGMNELVLLFGGAALGFVLTQTMPRSSASALALPSLLLALARTHPNDYQAWRLFLGFLKIGSVLYGSGYVLLAFLQGEFVDRLGWLTQQQLLDAVAVGQFTPGPVFTTATFVGYVIGGFPGAVLATLGIFLPAFVFVGLSHSLFERFSDRPWVRPLLDAVNVAAIGLMAAVAVILARDAVVDPLTAMVFAVALVLVVRFKVNSALLVIGGALVSVASHLLF